MTDKQNAKLRIGIIFGGRSGEHEVSLASARAIMDNLDTSKYEVVPIGITRNGTWLLGAEPALLLVAEQASDTSSHTTAVTLTGDPSVRRLIPLPGQNQPEQNGALDVVFPVLHGTYGEDGAIQGLLEMANLPYVGSAVLGSALGMDKEKMKMIFQNVGLPVGPYLVFLRSQWEYTPDQLLDTIEQQLGYPNFVKPVNLGSSVGINKAHDRAELRHAMQVAAEYDRKIIIETAINCREIECAILGNDEPIASVVGEIIPCHEFYDYNAKYIDDKSQIIIPANIPQEIAEELRCQALRAFSALDLSGMARIDFFLDKQTNTLYINEVNTLPGFTQISMYAKLWNASGIAYSELLDRLIALALERYADHQRNRTTR